MKNVMSLAVIVVCLLGANTFAALWTGDSGFESYTVGADVPAPWEGYGVVGSVTDADARTGDQSVVLAAGSTTGQGGGAASGEIIGQTIPGSITRPTLATIDFSFKHAGTLGYGANFLYVTDGASEVYARIYFAYWGGILNTVDGAYTDNVCPDAEGHVAAGWHDVSLTLDHTALTMDLWYDGVLVGDDMAFYDSDGSSYTNNASARVYLQTLVGNGDDMYVDDFTMVPEPTTMALLGLGGLLLRRRRA